MPIQIVGEEKNDSLMAGIIKFAEDTSAKALHAARANQFMQGKARVAAGEGLAQVKEGQKSAIDKLFGNATIQGASAQTVIQAADKFSLYLNSNMEQFKSQTPEEFASTQSKYITDNLLTTDKDTNDYITLAASDVITRASSVHAKHHEIFKQQNNKLQFETSLSGSSEVFDQSLTDGAQSSADRLLNLDAMWKRAQPMPGQTAEAHRESLAQIAINDLKNGRPTLYNALIKGSVSIDGQVIPIPHSIQFDSNTKQLMQEQYKKYEERTDVSKTMDQGMSLAELVGASTDETVGNVQLLGLIKEKLEKHGADFLTPLQISTLMTSQDKSNNVNKDKIRGIQSIADDSASSNPNRSDVGTSLDLYEQVILQQAQKAGVGKSEGAARSILENAHAAVLQKSITQAVVPPSWNAKWNTGFSNLLTLDGSKKVNPVFVETMRHFNSKYNAPFDNAKELYTSGIDAAQLANMHGVKMYMEGGMDVEQAILHQASHAMTSKEATEYLKSDGYKKKIEKFLKDPDQKGVISDFFTGEWKAVENKAEAIKGIEHYIARSIAETGISGDGTFAAAVTEWKKTHEPVRGKAANNYGIPLSRKAGLRDPSVKFTAVLDYYLNTRGGESALDGQDKFGPGFISSNADIKIDPNYVTITPRDSEGCRLPGLEGEPRTVPIAAMGAIYNSEVTDMGILDKLNSGSGKVISKLLGAANMGTAPMAASAKAMEAFGFFKGSKSSPEWKAAKQKEEELFTGLKNQMKSSLMTVPGKAGKVVVDHTVQTVESVLGGTNGFLARVAHVESQNGTHKNTFNGVSNGIWQVDDIGLEDTKIPTPRMQEAWTKVQQAFGIDWQTVKEDDLRKPLYGAIAARLYMIRQGKDIPSTLEEQAVYWKENYNKSGKGSPDTFLNKFK